ncbi:MAG: hypothetical protein JWR33_1350 [Naasia sp.]|uniref:G5 domain-containing protein n=1 Tax=Naasia sp. TaxID=2546198 RepID=UPI0026300F5A|nr:G5 domain-containing protein [Naasia sp.]MCU1570609.1 hypothetical protein [Naasia sp.]
MNPSAGWYDDPYDSNSVRWWDGAQWTTGTQTRPAPVVTAAAASASSPEPTSGSTAVASPRRFKTRTIILAAAAGVLLFVSGAVAAGNAATQLALSVAAVRPTATAVPLAAPVPTTTSTPRGPVITYANTEELEPVAFKQKTVKDADRDSGTSEVTQTGRAGVRTKSFRITLRDGKEVDRVLLTDEVTTAPVDEVTTVGTYVAPAPEPAPDPEPVAEPDPEPEPSDDGCDPNYSGACVPIDSDVDCAGGSGNGPSYVSGPVYVDGSDIYDLDRDGDGVACDA